MLDLIRGQRAEHALQVLRFTKKRKIAKDIEKILRSAIANAERKADDAGESLDVDPPVRFAVFRERRTALEASASSSDGPRVSLCETVHAHIVVGVAEHVMGAEQRAAAAAAEAELGKGVKGAVKKAREVIAGSRRPQKKQPPKPSKRNRIRRKIKE